MAKKRIKFGNTILCDYVGRGNRNKHVLVNVYSGNVRFDVLPSEFTFGLYIELPAQGLTQVTVSLRLDGVEFMAVKAESDESRDGTIIMPLVQIGVERPATLTVVISADGFASATALTKRLYSAEPTDPNA